ncbi:MAG: tetratricopeptide repeat protein [Bacteroidota bacterium]
MKKYLLLITLLYSFSVFAQKAKNDKLSYDDLIEKGVEKDAMEDFEEAVEIFTEAIELEPMNPVAYDKRAVTYLKLNKYSKALKDINTAIEKDPTYAVAYNHRGLTNFYMNKSILALQDFDTAIQLDPKFGRAYFNRALVKLEFGDVEGAYADLKKAGSLDYDKAEDTIWKYCADRLFVVPPVLEEPGEDTDSISNDNQE